MTTEFVFSTDFGDLHYTLYRGGAHPMGPMHSTIGKEMDETRDLDWAGFWPIIDTSGTVVGIADSDTNASSLKPVDWNDGGYVLLDRIDHGFDAYLKE